MASGSEPPTPTAGQSRMTKDQPHTHSKHHDHDVHGDGNSHPSPTTRGKVVTAGGSTHSEHAGHGGHDHGAMVADFRRRFWVTLILTPPVLLLSPMIQHWFGIAEALSFPG